MRSRRAQAWDEAGQSLAEYALVAALLLLAGVVAAPSLARSGPELLDAVGIYLDGFSFAWSRPVP